MPILTVTFVTAEGPLTFVFNSWVEANSFADHMRTYYGFKETVPILQGIDTYDSAIQAVVEAIGPSKEY